MDGMGYGPPDGLEQTGEVKSEVKNLDFAFLLFHSATMKTTNFSSSGRPTPRFRSALLPCGALMATAWLLAGPALIAQTVKTLGGGPGHGYVDGDTLNVSKYYAPMGLALDRSGNLLYVADM